jgi:hypothetical protein
VGGELQELGDGEKRYGGADYDEQIGGRFQDQEKNQGD